MISLDAIDKEILANMQVDCQISNAELAKKVNLSAAGVHKRLKKLRSDGYFKQDASLLNRDALGLDLLCFLKLSFKQNLNPYNYKELRAVLKGFPEILECHALTGSDDAILKVLVKDHANLKDFLLRFSESQDCIAHVQTSIVLEEIKATTCLPLDQVKG